MGRGEPRVTDPAHSLLLEWLCLLAPWTRGSQGGPAAESWGSALGYARVRQGALFAEAAAPRDAVSRHVTTPRTVRARAAPSRTGRAWGTGGEAATARAKAWTAGVRVLQQKPAQLRRYTVWSGSHPCRRGRVKGRISSALSLCIQIA